MVVNLYADHLLDPERNNRIRPAEEIWYATILRTAFFAHAAKVAGLSHREYREFQLALLDGHAVHVKLPKRVDRIVGFRHGRLYAVRDAYIRPASDWPSGYRVTLRDGNQVFVPDGSGSFSLLEHHHTIRTAPHRGRKAATFVYVQAPPASPPRPTLAVAVRAAKPSAACRWWCFGLPLEGILASFARGGYFQPK